MKKCPNCQNVYDDTKGFCPTCGVALVDETQNTSAGGGEFFEKWGALLLGAVGLIICWFISAVVGCVISIIGAVSGWRSSNVINKIGSIILAVICLVLTVMTI